MSNTIKQKRRPPLYRNLEVLLTLVCEMTDRCYKGSRALVVMTEGLITDIRESISYAAIALNTEDVNVKLNCIQSIKMKMWVIDTTIERIFFSAKNSKHHFLSEEQFGRIIDLMNEIEKAQGLWQNKYITESHN